jgi:hypothetical protein
MSLNQIKNSITGELQKIYFEGIKEGFLTVLRFIEYERDNGNLEGENGFSAAICLSNLMRYINESLEENK